MQLSGDKNSYSSPLLVINLYKDDDKTEQSDALRGAIIHKNEKEYNVNLKTHKKTTEQYIKCTEELKIIPVQDIISIRYTSRFRKAIYHEERTDKAEEMHIKRGVFKDKKEVKEVAHKTTKDTSDAKRLITIEIEYFK